MPSPLVARLAAEFTISPDPVTFGGFIAVEALSALVIIGLVYVGVRARLAEYRASR